MATVVPARGRTALLAVALLAGCGGEEAEAPPPPRPVVAADTLPPASVSYELVGPDESVGWTTTQRYTTRILVPPGRTRAEVEATLDRAARDLLARHVAADAAMVFAFRPGDPLDGEPTVGTAVHAANGNWIHASSTGPMRTSYELAESYFEAPADSVQAAPR